MLLNLALVRMLGAAVVLAALSFASSPASAHAGHHHATAAASISHERPVAAAVTAELSATPVLPVAPSNGVTCDGFGCCSSGPCTGCHGFVAATVTMPMPPFAASSLARPGAPPLPDPRDNRLRRPPNSLV